MSDPLANFSTEELLKIKSGDVSGLSTEKLQLLRGILSQAPMFSAPEMTAATAPKPAPTQRLRSIAQGALTRWRPACGLLFQEKPTTKPWPTFAER